MQKTMSEELQKFWHARLLKCMVSVHWKFRVLQRTISLEGMQRNMDLDYMIAGIQGCMGLEDTGKRGF